MSTYGFIHAEYGDRYRQQSTEMLAQLRWQLAGPSDLVSMVIVDSASSSAVQACTTAGFESALVMGGDPSNRDFSGWDKGVSATLARGILPDIWVFSNDTVARNHGWGSRKITHYARELSKLREHAAPWLFGEIHDFPRSILTPLGPQLEWVTTYTFSMNETLRSGLQTISPGNALLDALVWDSFEPGRGIFREHVDTAYAAFLSSWLIKPEGERPAKNVFKWYKAAPLTAETFDEFRMKVRCCISESMLSYRARQLGADIRSPYEAYNVRGQVRQAFQRVSDKIGEKLILRRQRS